MTNLAHPLYRIVKDKENPLNISTQNKRFWYVGETDKFLIVRFETQKIIRFLAFEIIYQDSDCWFISD